MKLRFTVAAVLALFLLAPAAPARADVVLTPYVGSLFGGDLSGNRAAFGANAAFMGGGIFGAEFGFNYAPEFVKRTSTLADIAQMSLDGQPHRRHSGGQRSAGPPASVCDRRRGAFPRLVAESEFFDHVTSNDFAVNFGGGSWRSSTSMSASGRICAISGRLTDSDSDSGIDDINFDLGDLNFWKWDVGAAFKF